MKPILSRGPRACRERTASPFSARLNAVRLSGQRSAVSGQRSAVSGQPFDSYLVWEEGTPDVAFEVLSPSDTPERWTFEEKLRRYHALGVRELVTFHVEAPAGERLRIWDRLEHDLVERAVTGIAEARARESAERARQRADERIRELEEQLAAARPRRDG